MRKTAQQRRQRKEQRDRKARKDTNVLVIGGRLMREVRDLGSFVAFDIVVNTVESIEGNWIEVPFFLEVKVFGVVADNCAKYLSRGREAQITGSLIVNEYQLKLGGKPAFYDEQKKRPVMMKAPGVLASDIRFL